MLVERPEDGGAVPRYDTSVMRAERRLHCLGGQPVPDGIERDLARILELPASARARFWEVLGPCLAEPLPDTVEGRLDAFCRAHEAPSENLARALKACRFLLWQASSRGLACDAFAADLASLHPSQELADILLAGYDAAKAQVERELLRAALLDHGNVLEGVDWRVDHVATSSRGGLLHEPVGVLTLRYRAGGKSKRLTVQLVPDALRELHQACESVVAAVKRTR
jgi:hypothetical protein